jgi:hypothetical protein
MQDVTFPALVAGVRMVMSEVDHGVVGRLVVADDEVWLAVRVLVGGEAVAAQPMRVLLPAMTGRPPGVGTVVECSGLRFAFREFRGRCRCLVLADELREVASDVAA